MNLKKDKKKSKTIVMSSEVNLLLEELARKTNYNQSEIIEISLRQLAENKNAEQIIKFNFIIENTIEQLCKIKSINIEE